MAATKALRQKLNEEFLTCQICLSVYKDPTLLDCQHSFCRTCVAQCSEVVGGGIHCPVCRQRTLVPRKNGVSTLKKNFFIQSLIDTIGRKNSLGSKEDVPLDGNRSLIRTERKTCDTCDDGEKAVKRCLDCCDFLCADCFLIHKHTKFTRGHKIVGLSSLKSGKYTEEIQNRAKVFCSVHDAQICRVFCQDCHLPACQECMDERCQSHSMVQIKVAVEDIKSTTSDILEKGELEITKVYDWLNEVATAKRRRKSDREVMSQEIDARVKMIVQAVKQRGKLMQEAMKTITSEHVDSLEAMEKKGRKKLAMLEGCYNTLKIENEQVAVSGGPKEILTLHSHVEKLKKSLKAANKLDEINRSWLNEDSCMSLLHQQSVGEKVSEMFGKIVFNEYMTVGSRKFSGYNLKGLVSTEKPGDKTTNVTFRKVPPTHCSPPPSYVQIRPTSIETSPFATDLDGAESPSMQLRRKTSLARSTDYTFSSSENLDDENVFTDDCEADHIPQTSKSLDAIDNASTSHLQSGAVGISRESCYPSLIRRSKSLATLSDQCVISKPKVPPKPLPRKKTTSRKINESVAMATTSRPRSLIDPHSLLRQPIRHKSSEPIGNMLLKRAESQGQCIIQYFDVCGQTCRFTSAPKIALLPNGSIVATDYKTQKVYRFSEDGVILNSFKVGSNGKDVHPIGLATTKKGKIVVTCGETVRILAPNGKSSRKFGSGIFAKSCGIACDFKSNKIIVSDIDKKCLSIHSNDGALQQVFHSGSDSYSSLSSLDDAVVLHTPYFITVDQRNGNIIASDWSNHDVKIYDREGNCLDCISTCYTDDNGVKHGFLNPAGVCCDEQGNLFIADHGHHRIAMFSNNWEFQRFVATEEQNLRSPWSIAVNSRGKLLVSEYWSKIVKMFSYM